MLSLACPICSSPIYQTKEGDTICVVCNRPVKLVSKEELEEIQSGKEQNRKDKLSLKPSPAKRTTGKKQKPIGELSVQPRVQRILYEKLDFVLDRIETESDLGMLSQLLDVLEQLLTLIELAGHTSRV